jgi:hypothetical protein
VRFRFDQLIIFLGAVCALGQFYSEYRRNHCIICKNSYTALLIAPDMPLNPQVPCRAFCFLYLHCYDAVWCGLYMEETAFKYGSLITVVV